MLKRRSFQDEATKATVAAHSVGQRRNILVLPTGCGKTVVMAEVIKELGGFWIVLVHRKELAKQGADKIGRWNPTLKVGIEMGVLRSDVTDDVVVASVQSLREGSSRLLQFDPAKVAGIMVDECHHATNDNSYSKIFQHFGVDKPGCRIHLLGVTATDMRGDGKSLHDVFDNVVYKMSMFDAVTQGWLVDLRGIKVSTFANLDKVKTVAGDFNQGQLETAVNTPERNKLLVEAWLENAENRQTIAFTAGIKHAKDLAAMFKAHGVRAEAVWGDDPERSDTHKCDVCGTYSAVIDNEDKACRKSTCAGVYCFIKGKIENHKAGTTQILCNDNVLTEGYDDPKVSCILQTKPTKSPVLYRQQIGRGTRLPESVDNLVEAKKIGQLIEKSDCIIIDAVDNTSRHSLMTLAGITGLNPQLNLRGRSVFAVKTELDTLQAANPNLNVAGLDDVRKLTKIVEQVDLWKVKYPEEIIKESPNKWHKTSDGQYIMTVSQTEGARVSVDLLDTWHTHFKVGDNEFNEDFPNRRQALEFADRMLRLCAGDRAYFQRRNTVMDHQDATIPQLNMLKHLRVKHPPIISKGMAAQLITQAQSKLFTLGPRKQETHA